MSMQASLLDGMQAEHDPGGLRTLRMPPGMRGGATFTGPGEAYRPLLWREWGAEAAPYDLYVGMNPSMAGPRVNDTTVHREIGFTSRRGVTAYHKVNVSDLRFTDPRKLQETALPLRSAGNLACILAEARSALRVVAAFGSLGFPPLRALAEETVAELRAAGIQLWCLGTTKDGSPRHPSRLGYDCALVPWDGWS